MKNLKEISFPRSAWERLLRRSASWTTRVGGVQANSGDRQKARRRTFLCRAWEPGLALALFVLASTALAQPSQVFPFVSVQPDRILLSGSTQLTLAIEGPAPLRVDLPKEAEKLLTSESATVWQIRPLGKTKITPLDGGRERWEQKFRLSPFVPGEKLTTAFAPLKVLAGGQLNSQEILFPSKDVRVQTTIADVKAEQARPVTGIEPLPTVVPPEPESIGWQFAAVLGCIFAAVLIVVLIRKSRSKPPPVAPGEWAESELDRLERNHALERIAGFQAADRLAAILREFMERRFGLSATKLTTAELVVEFGKASWPVERNEEIQRILERCDLAKFAGEPPETQDLQVLLNDSRRFVTQSISASK
jgi:hypothetical protein